MQETWVRSLGWEDSLERGTATHSNILAWRIPWTKEPGMLQSMGSQRVGHNLGTKQNTKTRQALLNRCPGKFKFCFLELSGIFFLVFLIHSWLTLQMQNTQIWRVDCVCVCVYVCVWWFCEIHWTSPGSPSLYQALFWDSFQLEKGFCNILPATVVSSNFV